MREASHRQVPFAIRGSFSRSLYRNGEDTIQMKEVTSSPTYRGGGFLSLKKRTVGSRSMTISRQA